MQSPPVHGTAPGKTAGSRGADPGVRCALCHRRIPPGRTSVHHLRPRSHGGGPDDEALLCAMCHSFLHATFTNRTLAEAFRSLEELRADPEVRNFVRWVRKQKPHRRIDVHRRTERR